MGLFRLLIRLLVRGTRPRPHYRYTPPPVETGDGKTQLVSVRVTRQTMVIAASQAGAALSGRCWVIDGDTIDIGGKRIRLAGIDAPELDHPYGKKAKATLVRLCQGKTVRAEFDGQLSYDRSMATCYLPDGRDLSAEMVKLGMAIDWPRYSGGKYRAYEAEGIRKRLWRCDARQKGLMPPPRYGQD